MKSFFKTVAIVTVFSVSEKFLGFIYRIYMSHSIGAEGVGLFQVALSAFGFLFTLINSGIPITVSRLMTKYKAQNDQDKVAKIITAGLTVALILALPVCSVLLIFNKNFAFIFADDRCMKILLILLPGLIFTSIYSVLRGVFWGNKDFLPYSIIELLEEICMIIVGVILINGAVDVYDGAVKAGVAVVISYLFSFTLAVAVFLYRKNRLKNPVSQLKPLILSSAPVTVMRTVSSLSSSLVSIILPMRLIFFGLSNSEAMSLYGSAVGQAVPLLFIPSSLISSFILVLIPEISENYYKKLYKNLKNDIEKSINFTSYLTCAFIPVFLVCGKELGVIVFNSTDCGNFLTASAFLVVFMGLSNITTSILNSLGAENKVLLFYMIGGIFMLICVWFLPKFAGVYSLLVGFLFTYGLTTVFNLILIRNKSPLKPKIFSPLFLSLILTLPAALIGILLEKMLLNILGNFLTVAVCASVMIAFYVALLFGCNLLNVSMVKAVLPKTKIKQKKLKSAVKA